MADDRRADGFFLAEVVIALGVISIGLAAALHSISYASKAYSASTADQSALAALMRMETIAGWSAAKGRTLEADITLTAPDQILRINCPTRAERCSAAIDFPERHYEYEFPIVRN